LLGVLEACRLPASLEIIEISEETKDKSRAARDPVCKNSKLQVRFPNDENFLLDRIYFLHGPTDRGEVNSTVSATEIEISPKPTKMARFTSPNLHFYMTIGPKSHPVAFVA
jgi:hypothetical protein